MRYEDELRADLQQYYNIDLDHAEAGAHTAAHVSALVSKLPPDSRIHRAVSAGNAWTQSDVLLGIIATSIRDFMYLMAGDKGKRPEPVLPDYMKENTKQKDNRRIKAQAIDLETFKQLLKNKEV